MGLPRLPGPPGQNPVGAALTTQPNTFTGDQTINGKLTLGTGGGVQFADGSVQATASLGGGGGIPAGYMITGTTPVAPPGYTLSGGSSAGNLWIPMAPMPTARYELAAAPVNGKIYAIGGFSSSSSGPFAAVNGKIYAIGGFGPQGFGTGAINTMEVYDPTSNSWSPRARMPTARYQFVATAVNGKIYAIGGFTDGGMVNYVEVYDPSSNSWSTTATVVNPRDGTLLDVPLAPMPTTRSPSSSSPRVPPGQKL